MISLFRRHPQSNLVAPPMPPGEDWHMFIGFLRYDSPAEDIVECWRDGWVEPVLISMRAMPLETNIAGLYWRYPAKAPV